MKIFELRLGVFVSSLLSCHACLAQVRVLVDHVGYDLRAPKQAIIVGTNHDNPLNFSLINTGTGKLVLTGHLKASGQVRSWDGRVFWTADFSSWQEPGHYSLHVNTGSSDVSSCDFEIDQGLLEREILSNVVYYFKGQRASWTGSLAETHSTPAC